MNYGLKIKELRKKLGYSQEYFASKIKLKRSNLSQIEIGRSTPTLCTIHNIVTTFNIDANYFHHESVKNYSTTNEKPALLNDRNETYSSFNLVEVKNEQIADFRKEIEYLRQTNTELLLLARALQKEKDQEQE